MGKLVSTISVILFFHVISTICTAQTVYLNSYVSDSGNMANCIFEIDLAAPQTTDSLLLPTTGAFTSGVPTALSFGSYRFIISSLVNGLPAKNSQIRDKTYSYYFLIDAHQLNVLREDSLVNKMIANFSEAKSDSVSMDWIDEDSGEWNRSIYTVDPVVQRLRRVSSQRYDEQNDQNKNIGAYVAPHLICQRGAYHYYFGYQFVGDSSFVNVIKVNSDSSMVHELRIGDKRFENIVTGYSSQTGKIYSFVTPYKHLSSYPVTRSPEYVKAEVMIINPEDLAVEATIPLEMGDAYAAQETGRAKSEGPYLYYYFFRQDGYGQFDPAYLLIFDTRTNEASWLRVGWR